jgi:hypothetical protein
LIQCSGAEKACKIAVKNYLLFAGMPVASLTNVSYPLKKNIAILQ